MKALPTKKLIIAALFVCCIKFSVSSQATDVYTIQKAQQCFHSQALAACQDTINECLTKDQCQKELHFYHDCNFEKEFTNQVFNGNCFREWKKSAVASKQVIECLDSQCNLAGYNSEVSLKVLYSCTTQALIKYPIECDQKCQQILKNHISTKIPYEPISEIYKQDIQSYERNQSVERIIEVIKKECIEEDGEIRKRQQQQNLSKKLNKQKMIDLMNSKNKDEAHLNKFNTNNKTDNSSSQL